MKKKLAAVAVITALVAGPAAGQEADGLVVVRSDFSVAETVERVRSAVEARGLNVFSVIDHAANAAGVDLALPPTVLVLFGNPSVGTRLMRCARSVAIDLPQKMLVWEDDDGVWIGYNAPAYLDGRHGLDGCREIVERVSGALRAIAVEAAH